METGCWAGLVEATEFWAAIAGAVVGGVIALGIQWFALRAAAKQRAKEAEERKQALAYALLFKMTKVHSNFHNLHRHLEEPFERDKTPDMHEPWQFVRPVANNPEYVHFSADEMGMLLALKDNDLFNAIISMDQIHNSTIGLFDTFKERRLALTSQIPAQKMEGIVGKTFLTKEQAMLVRPIMEELNDLIIAMRERCKRDVAEAWDILTRLGKTLRDKAGITVEIQLKSDKRQK